MEFFISMMQPMEISPLSWSDVQYMNIKALLLLAGLLVPVSAFPAAYSLPEDGSQVVGAVTTVRVTYEDTLASVAEKYGLGYQEVLDANPDVDPWIPGEGTEVVLPTAYVLPDTPREGIVINVAEYRLYHYLPERNLVVTYPVGLGRDDFRTPLATTKIVTAIENPSWTPTATPRAEHASRSFAYRGTAGAGQSPRLSGIATGFAELFHSRHESAVWRGADGQSGLYSAL